MFKRETILREQLSQLRSFEESELGGVILLQGTMGMGKSSLMKEFLQSRSSSRQLPLFIETPLPRKAPSYSLLQRILEAFVAEEIKKKDSKPTVVDLVKRHFPKKWEEFSPLLTLLGFPLRECFLPYLLPEEREGLLHTLATNLLRKILTSRSYLLMIDDIELADEKSIDILEDLVDHFRNRAIPLYLFLTASQAMAFSEKRITHKITLSPLGREEIHAFLCHKTERPSLKISPPLLEWLYGKTRGHPFFVEQLFFYLQEQGGLTQKKDEISLGEEKVFLPTLQAAIMGRIDLLQEESLRVLKIASVLGRSWDEATLQEVAKSSSFQDLSKELVKKRFFQQIGENRYTFCHPLIQQVAYNTLLKSKRSLLHEQVAGVLEAHGDHPEALLEHYLETENREKKFLYLKKLAKEKEDRCLYEEASYFYHMLLEEMSEEEEGWRENKKSAVKMLMYQGEINLTIGHVAELLESCDAQERPWIYMVLARLHEKKKDYPAAIQYSRQALGVLGPEDHAIRARVKTLMAANLKSQGELEVAENYLMEALDESADEEPLRGDTFFHLGEIYRLKNSCESAISCYLQGAEIFGKEKRLPRYFECLDKLGLLYLKTEMWEEAQRAFRGVIEFYKKVKNSGRLGESYYYLGLTLMRNGRAPYARTLFKRAIALLEGVDTCLWGMAYFHLAEIEEKAKNSLDAEKLVLQAIRIFDEAGNLASLDEAQKLLQQIESSPL